MSEPVRMTEFGPDWGYHHPDFEYNPEEPLVQGTKETASANEALNDYYHLGSTRSLAKLQKLYETRDKVEVKVPTSVLQTLRLWSVKYQWQERVALQAKIDYEERHQVWIERREQVREEDWQVSNKLRDIADALLENEIRRIEAGMNEDGKVSLEKFDAFAVSKLIDLSAKLRRLATELPASISKLEADIGLSGGIGVGSDVEAMLDWDEEKINETIRRLSNLGIDITEDFDREARGEVPGEVEESDSGG